MTTKRNHDRNPIDQRIAARINSLQANLDPLAESCRKYLQFCSAIDADDETMMIGHMPWESSEKYLIVLFPSAKKSWFPKYTKIHGVTLPPQVKSILLQANGCEIFGISLFGMPPSMLKSPPTLDRSTRQCLDIATANTSWKYEYEVSFDAFFFGARYYSETENAGYFLKPNGTFYSSLTDGTVLGEWHNVTSLLEYELSASEKRECSEIPKTWWH